MKTIKRGVALLLFLMAMGLSLPLLASKQEALFRAIHAGDSAKVGSLLAKGADPNMAIEDEFPPLEEAALLGYKEMAEDLLKAGAKPTPNALSFAIYGTRFRARAGGLVSAKRFNLKNDLVFGDQHLEVCSLLLGGGANPNAQDEDGYTPLEMAVMARNADAAQLLLSNGAKPDAPDKDGDTALMVAAGLGKPLFVDLLLSHGANPNAAGKAEETALLFACATGEEECAMKLLKAGANPNAGPLPSPLFWAARLGKERLCGELIARGAQITGSTEDGVTLLHEAAFGNLPSLCQRLVGSGVLPSLKDSHGSTPLHWAAENGALDSVKLLLQLGADVNTKDNQGFTPLHEAVFSRNEEICRLLLEKGADANASASLWANATPLHVAAAMSQANLCELLLAHGANPSQTMEGKLNDFDFTGWTPVHLAAFRGNRTDVLAVLLAHGANPGVANSEGCTPLHLAAGKGFADTCAFLLAKGAPPNAKDKSGFTPMDYIPSKDMYKSVVKAFSDHDGERTLSWKKQGPSVAVSSPDLAQGLRQAEQINESMAQTDRAWLGMGGH
jgi:cytohesin